MNSGIRQEIDVLFQRLLLGDPSEFDAPPGQAEYDYAFARAFELLHAHQDQIEGRRFELRLRLALHLSPAEAIAYDSTNSIPRYRLIRQHLVEQFHRPPELADQLARDIAKVLRNWEEGREAVAGHLSQLLMRQDYRCAHCNMHFNTPPATEKNRDPLKPYHLAPEELKSPEVDHIEAVSCLGTNELRNLQVLCRLCNGGKGDGLGLDVRREMKFSGFPPEEADRHYRAQLLYYVILRDQRRCRRCSSNQDELTIRQLRPAGALARSNMITVCVKFAYPPTPGQLTSASP